MSTQFTQRVSFHGKSEGYTIAPSIGWVDIPLRGEVTAVENNLVTVTYSFADTGEVVEERTMSFPHALDGMSSETEYYYLKSAEGTQKVDKTQPLPINATWNGTESVARTLYYRNLKGEIESFGVQRLKIACYRVTTPTVPEWVMEDSILDRAYQEFKNRDKD